MSRGRYTCEDYRLEMTLAGLRQRLWEGKVADDTEKEALLAQIRKLETVLGMD